MQIQLEAVETLGDETSRLQQGSNAPQRVVSDAAYLNDEGLDAQRTCNASGIATDLADYDEHLGRRDALPEHTAYRDTGCDLNPTCLDCPLARCRYDMPSGYRYQANERRERVLALRREGMSAVLVAQALGVSRRTVFRLSVLAR